jgi:hypothetical protein
MAHLPNEENGLEKSDNDEDIEGEEEGEGEGEEVGEEVGEDEGEEVGEEVGEEAEIPATRNLRNRFQSDAEWGEAVRTSRKELYDLHWPHDSKEFWKGFQIMWRKVCLDSSPSLPFFLSLSLPPSLVHVFHPFLPHFSLLSLFVFRCKAALSTRSKWKASRAYGLP